MFSLSIDLGQDDSQKHPTTNTDTQQRRLPSINRQQLQETICRLAKPKTIPMPSSQSSHQLRASTPPVSNALTRKVRSLSGLVVLFARRSSPRQLLDDLYHIRNRPFRLELHLHVLKCRHRSRFSRRLGETMRDFRLNPFQRVLVNRLRRVKPKIKRMPSIKTKSINEN